MIFRARLRRLTILSLAGLGLAAARTSGWYVNEMAAALVPEAIANVAIVSLEYRFTPALVGPGAPMTGIIVLGGHPDRIEAALKLAKSFPNATLVITGAPESDYAAVLKGAAQGQPVVIEPRARNTFENAVYTKKAVSPRPGERWLLVTSATHMPRAIGCFRRVNFAVEPWPVFDSPKPPRYALPGVQKEFLGLLAYRLLGRTSSIFPGPAS